MSEPLVLGTVSSATQVFSGFNQYFKPSRSPYLLSGLLCVVCLVSIAGLPNGRDVFFLVFIPIGGIFTALSILCFYFKPRKSGNETDKETAIKEMDEEFKFSRTVCLSIGIMVFTYLIYKVLDQPFISLPLPFPSQHSHVDIPRGLFFWISYGACLLHLIIFLCYVFLRNLQEEAIINLSLFQITFFTVASLLGLVFSGATVQDQENAFYSCNNMVTYTVNGNSTTGGSFSGCSDEVKKQNFEEVQKSVNGGVGGAGGFTFTTLTYLDSQKVLFWFFLIHLAAFEVFWVRRLKSVVRFKFDLVVLE